MSGSGTDVVVDETQPFASGGPVPTSDLFPSLTQILKAMSFNSKVMNPGFLQTEMNE